MPAAESAGPGARPKNSAPGAGAEEKGVATPTSGVPGVGEELEGKWLTNSAAVRTRLVVLAGVTDVVWPRTRPVEWAMDAEEEVGGGAESGVMMDLSLRL